MTALFDIDGIESRRVGRARIQDALEEAHNSKEGVALVVVEGASGVGKSHLLAHLNCEVDGTASSKYDSELDIRSGFVAALEELLIQQLTGSEPDRTKQVTDALAATPHVVATYFPKLQSFLNEPVLASQPQAYTTLEATQRFRSLVSELTNIAFNHSRNLITLDDLQWAAFSSLHLFRSVMREHLANLSPWAGSVIAFTARTNRAPRQDAWIDSNSSHLPVYRIQLNNLTQEEMAKCANIQFSGAAEKREFCDVAMRVTGGNPLRLARYSHWLTRSEIVSGEGNLLSLQRATLDSWEHLIAKLDDLSTRNVNNVTEAASCFTGQFHAAELARLISSEKPTLRTGNAAIARANAAIEIAVQDGWLANAPGNRLTFAHDQLLDQARERTSSEKRRFYQLQIGLGRLALNEDISGLLYLNEVLDDIPSEKSEEVCSAFLRGAEHANTANSPALSLRYCDAADYLLGRIRPTKQQLAATVVDRRASALLLQGEHEQLDKLMAQLPADYSRHSKLWASTHSTYLVSLLSRGQLDNCVRVAIQASSRLGVELPVRGTPDAASKAIQSAFKTLDSAPRSLDSIRTLAGQLLSLAIPAFHQSRPDLYPFAASAIVETSYGDTPADTLAFGIATLGIACSLSGKTAEGYALGQRAVHIAKEGFSARVAPRTNFAVRFLLDHQLDGLSEAAISELHQMYEEATHQGDTDHACYARHLEDAYRFHSSQQLNAVQESLANGSKIIEFHGQDHILKWNRIYEQMIENLVVIDRPPTLIHGSLFTEFSNRSDSPQLQFRVHLARLILATIFLDYKVASKEADLLQLLAHVAGSQFEAVKFTFYAALANFGAALNTDDSREHKDYLRSGDKFYSQYKELTKFRRESPKSSLRLLEGCRMLAVGETAIASDRLASAEAAADESGNTLQAALAAELLAIGDRVLQVESLAIQRARRNYQAWGAANKVARLDEQIGSRPRTKSAEDDDSTAETDARALNRLVMCRKTSELVDVFSRWLKHSTESDEVSFEMQGIWKTIQSKNPPEGSSRIPHAVCREIERIDLLLDAPNIENLGRINSDTTLRDQGTKAFLAIALRQSRQLVGIAYCSWSTRREPLPIPTLIRIENMTKPFIRLVENQLLTTAMESRIREHDDALTRANVNLSDAHAKVRQFERTSWTGLIVGGLSHEVSTPLASARLISDSLTSLTHQLKDQIAAGKIQAQATASLEEGVEMIRANLQTISERVRNASQKVIESDTLEKTNLRLHELIETAIDDIRFANPLHRQQRISMSIASSIEVETYQVLLRQVVENVLNNSFQHGNSNSPDNCIRIAAEQGKNAVSLEIRDDGPGFANPNMFAPFESHNRPGHSRSVTGGLGLGLSIAKSIMTGPLGGNIRASNADDGGAIVRIEIPNVVPDISAIQDFNGLNGAG